MFKDSEEGSTHYENDWCGIREHNDICPDKKHDFNVVFCKKCGICNSEVDNEGNNL